MDDEATLGLRGDGDLTAIVTQDGRELARTALVAGSVEVVVPGVSTGQLDVHLLASDGQRSTSTTVQLEILDSPELEIVTTGDRRWPRTAARLSSTQRGTITITATDDGSDTTSWTARPRSDGSLVIPIDLPDGDWTFQALLENGSVTSAPTTVRAEIAIGEIEPPDLDVVVDEEVVTVSARGPAGGVVDLILTSATDDETVAIQLDDDGAGTLERSLVDGSWRVTGTTTDAAGRESAASEPVDLEVDLLVLDLVVQPGSDAESSLAWSVTPTVAVDLVVEITDGDGAVIHRTEDREGSIGDLDGGTYTVTVTATSRSGREVAETVAIEVEGRSGASNVWLLVLTLGGIAYGGWSAVRRSSRSSGAAPQVV